MVKRHQNLGVIEKNFLLNITMHLVSPTAILVSRSGFKIIKIERLKEPSNKYTIRAILRLL